MPKDNEVDEKVIPDSAAQQVAAYRWRPIGWGVIGDWRVGPPEIGHIVIGDDRYEVEELVPAATVAELRAEVERLALAWRSERDASQEYARDCLVANKMLVAAERRVGELEAALRDLISVADPVALAPREYERIREQTARGTCISISIDPFPLLKCRYEDVVDLTDGLKRARATLTGADPT